MYRCMYIYTYMYIWVFTYPMGSIRTSASALIMTLSLPVISPTVPMLSTLKSIGMIPSFPISEGLGMMVTKTRRVD